MVFLKVIHNTYIEAIVIKARKMFDFISRQGFFLFYFFFYQNLRKIMKMLKYWNKIMLNKI